MTLIVEQKPLYKTLAAAQKLILSVTEDNGVVVNEKRVKFIFTVYAGKNKTDVTGQLPSTLVGEIHAIAGQANAAGTGGGNVHCLVCAVLDDVA